MSKSPSLKRIQADIRELAIDPSDRYYAAPLENDMFEWHFTIRGADGTDFEGGIYHGRILLPAEYPFKPPNIMLLTPSGRFETNTKVCLSFSAFHPELWQPAWGIRLILEALISFLPTKGDGAIGALDWTSAERKRLAKKSVNFVCAQCGKVGLIMNALDKRIEESGSRKKVCSVAGNRFQNEIEQLHLFQTAAEEERKEKVTNNKSSKDDSEPFKKPVIVLSERPAIKGQVEEQEFSSSNPKPIKETDVTKNNNEVSEENCARNSLSVEPVSTRFTQKVPSVSKEEVSEPRINNINSENDTATENVKELLDAPWFSDPVLNAGIITFSILCLLLMKKIQAIAIDITNLETEARSF